MAYSTQTGAADGDLVPARISVVQLQQLTSEDATSVVQKVVDDAIKDADALIDSYAGRRYTVPFDPVPSRIRGLSIDIAVFNLYSKRLSVTGGDVPEGVQKRYDDAVKFLRDVANGIAVIDGAVKPAENTVRTGGSVSSADRVFSPSSMGKL